MQGNFNLDAINIRTYLKSGDLGYIIYLHGILYEKEYDYGIGFESYVAAGLAEFYDQYDHTKDRVWICEHENKIIGFLALVHREGNMAQLRYFILLPAYRGVGLGQKLMRLYMDQVRNGGFAGSFLWTTNEQVMAARLYVKHGFKLVEENYSESFGKPLMEQKYSVAIS